MRKKKFLNFFTILFVCMIIAFLKIKINVFKEKMKKKIQILEEEKLELYNKYFLKYVKYQKIKREIDSKIISKKLNMIPITEESFIHIFIDIKEFKKFFDVSSEK